MDILFQDNEIIVCVKPAGTLSQSGKNGETDMTKILSGETGTPIYVVHRLDKNVGGVMVFAKTSFSAASLSAQIAKRSFVKEYLAVVHGTPESESATLEDLLFKDAKTNKTFVVDRKRKGVRESKLEYKSVRSVTLDGETVTIIRIRLYTGRSHQIRAQFASRKHPLVGDARYGAKDGLNKPALWSCRLVFTHPKSGEQLEFSNESPPWLEYFDEDKNRKEIAGA